MTKRRVGIVGFGHLGAFLSDALAKRSDVEVVFVWNRSRDAMTGKVDEKLILENLDDFASRGADLIVEVAHPIITDQYGERFLEHADYLVGSPTAFADEAVERRMRAACTTHGLFVPCGAFWGAEDVRRMVERGTLKELKVTMRKHPEQFRFSGDLQKRLEQVKDEKTVLYEGPVRELCKQAPMNSNTMAAAAFMAGFDKVIGRFEADPDNPDVHVIKIEVTGPTDPVSGIAFTVVTERSNPAPRGAVTGLQTYNSMLSSIVVAHGKGPGIHMC